MTQLKKNVKNKKEVEIVSQFRKNYVKEYVNFLIKKGNIKQGKVIVDIPCGTGDMAKAITEKVNVEKFVVIDINKNMVKSAKEKIINNVLAIVGDAGDIGNLIDFKVDTIICLNGFHQYINRKEDFLRGCEKILNKKGRLIFDISTRGLDDEYTRKFFQSQRKEIMSLSKEYNITTQFPTWPNDSILKNYRKMIFDSGLKLLDENEFTTFKTVSQILSDAITIPGRSRPWIPGLNYKKRKDIIKKSIEKTTEKLGKHKIEYNRIFFILEKTN